MSENDREWTAIPLFYSKDARILGRKETKTGRGNCKKTFKTVFGH